MSFYDIAERIDFLKNVSEPSQENISYIIELIKDEKYYSYFFNELKNASWAQPLHQNKVFYNVPEPREVEPGSYKLPWWYAGEYLKVVASEHPDIIVDVALHLETTNANAIVDVLEALLQVEPKAVARAVEKIKEWTNNSFEGLIPKAMADLIGHLVKNGQFDAALRLLEAMTEPLPPFPVEEDLKDRYYFSRARSKHSLDDYWLKDVLESHLPSLIKNSPEKCLVVFENNLTKAIEIEQAAMGEKQGALSYSRWRSAIEDHEQNRPRGDLKHLLVNGLRDSFIEICKKEPKAGQETISKYLDSPHSILIRIAIYIVRLFGKDYPDTIIDLLTNEEKLIDPIIHHEYYWLLHDQFGLLSKKQQRKIIELIFEGPKNLEERAESIASFEQREVTDQDRKKVMNAWFLRRLWPIRDYLQGKEKERLSSLEEEFGKPEYPDLLAWSTGVQEIKRESPISVEEMREWSVGKIIEYLKKFQPDDIFVFDKYQGIAEVLNKLVQDNPEKFTGDAHLFCDNELRLTYLYHFLGGIRAVLTLEKTVNFVQLIDLCEFIVNIENDPFLDDKDDLEPGLDAINLEVANLLDTFLKTKEPFIDEISLIRIFEILTTLTEHQDPSIEQEAQSSMDPATLSLNSIRGKALHALIAYIYYWNWKKGNFEKEGLATIPENVVELLNAKLDIKRDPSLAVHSVYGWYFANFYFLDKKWIDNNVDNIFPVDPNLASYWDAAWNAYVSFSMLYSDVFTYLVDQYKTAILRIGDEDYTAEDVWGRSIEDRLAQHIMRAFSQKLIDFDTDAGLFELFFEKTPDNVRDQGIRFVVQILQGAKPNKDSELWLRLCRLWNWRLDVADSRNNRDDYKDEISAFMRWLAYIPIELPEVFSLLLRTLPYIHEGYYSRLIIEYAAIQCEKYPLEAVEIYFEVFKLGIQTWFNRNDEEKILSTAIDSDDEATKVKAIEIINLYGEKGNFRWKPLLPKD